MDKCPRGFEPHSCYLVFFFIEKLVFKLILFIYSFSWASKISVIGIFMTLIVVFVKNFTKRDQWWKRLHTNLINYEALLRYIDPRSLPAPIVA